MGSLIKGVLFMPPLKAPEEDENINKKQKEEENQNTVLLDIAHGSKIKLIKYMINHNYIYLLISHGNAENIGIVYKWVREYLSNFVNVNIILYEYTGYDISQINFGCCEQYVYNDADAAFNLI